MRLVFLGSPPFATPVLAELARSEHEILMLVTPPDRPRGRGRVVVPSALVEFAREHDIEVYQPASSKQDDFLPTLAATGADVLMVASYGEILRTDVLELCPHGALNVHASLLPRWRGASPIQYAIRAGDERTGVSVQRMVLALDAGDVLLSLETPIEPDETSGQLLARLADLGGKAACQALDALQTESAQFEPQAAELVTHARKLTKDDGWIDWSQTADEVDRMVRSVTPWPGARTKLPNGRVISIEKLARTGESATGSAPGSLHDLERRLLVACSDELIEVVNLKPEGKASMTGVAFLRGARLQVGQELESRTCPD